MLGGSLELGTLVNGSGMLRMSSAERATHMHVVGNTGSGKSKFLEHLIRQDILESRRTGSGLLLIDPHGSLYDNLIAWLARLDITKNVIPIDFRRDDWIVAYNVLRRRPAAASVVVDSLIDSIAHVWGTAGTKGTPLFARWASNIFRVLYEKRYTLAEAVHLFSHHNELRRAMVSGVSHGLTLRDWELAFTLKPREFEEMVGSTVNRLRAFIDNEYLQTVFGQDDISLDLAHAIEAGAVVLVSLGRKGGRVSKEDTDLFGTLLLTDLWTAASERDKSSNPKPFTLYLDEFQRFLSPTLAESLDESRGFGLRLVCSHQFPLQLLNGTPEGERTLRSMMENARSKVAFSLSIEENLKPMAEWMFRGCLDPDEIKHALTGRKVLDYRLEYHRAYSYGETESDGGTTHRSSTEGSGQSGSESTDRDGQRSGESESWNRYFAEAEGSTSSWSRSTTRTVSQSPMLMPVMGEEISSVQFRSLDEQIHRAMAALFDQKQRQCVARLVGMRTPVSLFTPFVEKANIRPKRIDAYLDHVYRNLPCARRGSDARARVEERTRNFARDTIAAFRRGQTDEEPATGKRTVLKK